MAKHYVIKTVAPNKEWTFEDWKNLKEHIGHPIVQRFMWELGFREWNEFQVKEFVGSEKAVYDFAYNKGANDMIGEVMNAPREAEKQMLDLNVEAGLVKPDLPPDIMEDLK